MKNGCFRRYDLLNVPVPLSYKNEYFYRSNVGATLTIFIFLIIISITSYEIILLYSGSSFTLISNQYTDISQIIDFSQTPILFQLANDNGQLIDIDNKLIELEAYDIEVIITIGENGERKKKLKFTKLELEKCDKIFFNNSQYSSLNLSRYICFKPGQNLTSYGLMGDINNSFKGIRVYINKCSGVNCYNTTVFENKLHNAKFLVTYLSLSSNIFYLSNEKLKYQLFTKYFSLSTSIIKKIIFTYDIGRFFLNNNILYKNKKSFNYIIGNDYSIDVDLDPTNTLINNEYTLAYIGFHYGGIIIESRKEIQNIFESLSIIGNFFNIILTIFKIINNYFSNKILFVDIFRTIFFAKEKNKLNIKENIRLNKTINFINNKNNLNKKKQNLDSSDVIYFNNNKQKSIKQRKDKIIIPNDKNSMAKKDSKMNIKNNGKIKKIKLIYFYLLPLWILRGNKIFNNIYLIKDSICGYFSFEKINELIIFKKSFEDKSKKFQMSNTSLIHIDNFGNFYSNDIINKTNEILK